MRLIVLALSFLFVSLSPFCASAAGDTATISFFNGRWISQDRKTLVTFDLEKNRIEEQEVIGGDFSNSTAQFFNKNRPYTLKKNVLSHEEAATPGHSYLYTIGDDTHFSKMYIRPDGGPKVNLYTRWDGKESLNAFTNPWSWLHSLPRWNKKGNAAFTYSEEDRTIRFTDPGAITFLGAEQFPVYMVTSQVGLEFDLITFVFDHEKGGFVLLLTKVAGKKWGATIVNHDDRNFDLGTLVEAE